MMQLLYFPLAIIFFFFECRKSPLVGEKVSWTSLYWFMIKTRLLSIYSGNKDDVSVRFLNYKMYASDYRSLENLFHEIFVSGEYHYSETTFRPKVIFDCGANIGLATIYFKIFYPKVKIYSFEPNPVAFKYLERNIKLNNLRNVFLQQIALSDESGEVELFFDEKNLVTGSLNQDRDTFYQAIKVRAAKLSDFILSEEVVDLIKLDVEGAEIMIINELIKHSAFEKTKRYLIEYHNFEDLNKLNSFINSFGQLKYKIQVGAKINRKKKYQDILIYLVRDH